jgi:hypothetical protein
MHCSSAPDPTTAPRDKLELARSWLEVVETKLVVDASSATAEGKVRSQKLPGERGYGRVRNDWLVGLGWRDTSGQNEVQNKGETHLSFADRTADRKKY